MKLPADATDREVVDDLDADGYFDPAPEGDPDPFDMTLADWRAADPFGPFNEDSDRGDR